MLSRNNTPILIQSKKKKKKFFFIIDFACPYLSPPGLFSLFHNAGLSHKSRVGVPSPPGVLQSVAPKCGRGEDLDLGALATCSGLGFLVVWPWAISSSVQWCRCSSCSLNPMKLHWKETVGPSTCGALTSQGVRRAGLNVYLFDRWLQQKLGNSVEVRARWL
jgi:hypothetical protein